MPFDYKSRLPNQFSDAVNLHGVIDCIVDAFSDNSDILTYLVGITLDNAEGVWLNEIGEIVGVRRPSQQLTDDEIFAYCDFEDMPGDSSRGYSTILDPQGGHFASLDENQILVAPSNTPVSDSDYRDLIRAKILATYSNNDTNSVYNWILDVFEVESYVYNSNPCEIAVELAEYLTFYDRWILQSFAPVAAGVRIWIAVNPPYVPPVVLTQLEDEEEELAT